MDPAIDLLNPSIFVGSWEIQEPVTTLTDLMVAAVALICYAQLGANKPQHRVERLMRGYFLLMGVGVGLGGILGHALQAYLSWEWKTVGWIIAAFGVACYAMSAACLVQPRLHERSYRVIVNLIPLLLVGLLLAMALPETRSFEAVRIYNVACVLGLVLPLHLYWYVHEKNIGSRWVLLSIALACLIGLVFKLQINFGPWFNHLDISHVMMMLHTYFLYLATQRFLPEETKVVRG